MRRHAAAVLLVALLFGHFPSCKSWFLYGDISWNKDQWDPLKVHFELHTSWDRSGLPLALARVSAAEDITTFNAEWTAAVAGGPGTSLNVSIGATDYVRRRIGFGDGRYLNPWTGFEVTRVDPAVVHAKLSFSHTYAGVGPFEAFFEGCCRSEALLNNGGQSWYLSAEVLLLGSQEESPRMSLPAVVDLAWPAAGSSTTLQLGAYSAYSSMPQDIVYRLGDAEEMGYAMDMQLGLPWNETSYAPPAGVELSSGGLLSLSQDVGCAAGTLCLLHVTVVLEAGNVSATTDFMIRIIHDPAPAAEPNGYLVTPGSSPSTPVTITCGTSDFFPPASSTYSVSACMDLDAIGAFACSGFTGVCPPPSFGYVSPYDQPQYASCFAGESCPAGQQRLYCTDLAARGVSSSFLRVSFVASHSASAISAIRQASDLPAGMTIKPGCDGLGSCSGAPMEEMGSRYVDLEWEPDCAAWTQLRRHALCFTAVEGSSQLAAPPTCVYVEARNGSALQPDLAALQPRAPPALQVPANPTHPRANEWRLVLLRQAQHAVAEEPFVVQPQVAILDAENKLVAITEHAAFTVELGLDAHPGGSVLSGATRANAVRGIGAFTDLGLSNEGLGFTLVVRASGLSVDLVLETPRFTVLPPVFYLQLGTQPPNVTVAGEPIEGVQGPPVAFLFDHEWDYAALSTQRVTVAVDGGAAQLHGPTQVSAYQGVAAFPGLSINTAGEYRLRFAVARHSEASITFTIVAGHPTYLFVTQQPCAEPCPFEDRTQQVARDVFRAEVRLVDSFYNPTSVAANASASLVRFASFSQRTSLLTGDQHVPVSGGVGRFTDLAIEEQGFYSLRFSVSYGVLDITNTSVVFDVQLPVDALRIDVQPTQSVAGMRVQGPPTAVLLDAYQFTTESSRPVEAALDLSNATFLCAANCIDPPACVAQPNATCVTPAVISEGVFTTAVGGVAVMDAVVVLRAATGYRLQAVASSTASILTAPFDVVHGEPSHLVVSRLPYLAVLGEPFGVQPVVSLVDAYGNLAESVQHGTIAVALDTAAGQRFFLTGFIDLAVVNGTTMFDNVGVETSVSGHAEGLDRNISMHTLTFTYPRPGSSPLQVQTIPFVVGPGLAALAVEQEPAETGTAGERLGGGAAVSLSSADGVALNRSGRAVSVWLDESACPERYPVQDPVVARVTQAEVRGLVPLAINELFVVTRFKAVGVQGSAAALVKIIDGRYNCNSSAGVSVGGGDSQSLTCGSNGTCSTGTGELYLAFNLTQVPPSGVVRVCASVDGDGFWHVPVVVQQQATLQVQAVVPLTLKVRARPTALNRSAPLDETRLWYAGEEVDACNGFATSASDPRVAFVLSQDDTWDLAFRYECPVHPRTNQKYRWASAEEVTDLGTIFGGQGTSDAVYVAGCGAGGVLAGKTALAFSDSASRRQYAVLGGAETQALAIGTPAPSEVAGLVCILDEPHFGCSERCFDVPCPPTQEDNPVLTLEEPQELVLSVLLYSDGLTSPDLVGALDTHGNGNEVVLVGGTVGFMLSLSTEPASWVRVRASASPDASVVSWDDSSDIVFGSALWDLAGAGADAYDMPATHVVTCGMPLCENWALNRTVRLTYTLSSTVPAYDGKQYTLWLRRAPIDAEEAAAFLRQIPDVPFGLPPTTVPVTTPAPTPPPFYGEFCIRAGAYWPLGGDLADAALRGTVVWCGLTVKEMDTGAYHSCAVVDAGDGSDRGYVVCWGRNSTRQAAVPDTLEVSLAASDVLDAGTYHTCAVSRTGQAVCWGDNARGQLNAPGGVAAWESISCGAVHTCAVATDGTGYCWGNNQYGQTAVPGGITWKSISAGNFHTCGIDVNMDGYCWGAASGANVFDFGQTDVPVNGPWMKLSAGNTHSCGILMNGTALCWGLNDNGQTDVPDLGMGGYWMDIATGLQHTCGVASSGVALCWGSETESRLIVTPNANGPWMAVSVGYEHSCGILQTGRIACWGSSRNYQLAVSAAPPVGFSPGHIQFDRFGVPLPNPMVSVHTSFVDVNMTVSTPQRVDIYFEITQGPATLETRRRLMESESPRLDVWATITAQAVSNDEQLADGESISQAYRVLAGDAVIAPEGVAGGVEYETEVDVTITADADMNPYQGTDIYYSLDGQSPNVSGVLYTGPFVVGNETGNATGYTTVQAMAVRNGAVASAVTTTIFLTRTAAPVFFNGTNMTNGGAGQVISLLSDGIGSLVMLQSATPEAEIYYTICRPSQCAQPYDPSAGTNSTLYDGAILINETGTVVRALAAKEGLAVSRVSEVAYRLRLLPPSITPARNDVGYLSPLTFKLNCSAGSYGKYSDDGSYPNTVYIGPVQLYRSSAVSALCARDFMLDSETVDIAYDVTPVDIIEATLEETSQVVSAPNRLTLTLTTTRQITDETHIRVSGLTGSATPDTASLQVDNPRLSATWQQAEGVVDVTVNEPLPANDRLFAVTSDTQCAEELPFGAADDVAARSAWLSTADLSVMHRGWRQEIAVDGTPVLRIIYDFQERCTLRQRLTARPDSVFRKVRWVVEDLRGGGRLSNFTGFYSFSDGAEIEASLNRGAASGFAADDGVWGAVEGGGEWRANGQRPSRFWGQAVFDDRDSNPGQCGTIYFGSFSDTLTGAVRSEVYLVEVDATFVLSFTLLNPDQQQVPVTAMIQLNGTWTDAVGPHPQVVGPVNVSGAVLGAAVVFGLDTDQSSMAQSSVDPSTANVLSFDLRTNLAVPAGSKIIVSDISGEVTSMGGAVRLGSRAVPETLSFSFDCVGFRSCTATADNYVPAGAQLASATLSVAVACSDFNAADETIRTLTVDGMPVQFFGGPWIGCEGACGRREEVLSGMDVTSSQGGALQVYLAASPAVDAYSCSDSSTVLVDARVTVVVEYYYPGTLVDSAVHYVLQSINTEPACRDSVGDWTDSAGYGCSDYERYSWCTADSCGGAGWSCSTFANVDDGLDASQVCCACGAGTTYWTALSFEITNPPADSPTTRPRVALVDSDGFVLVNETVSDVIGAVDRGSVGTRRRRLLSVDGWSSARSAGASGAGRHLLSAHEPFVEGMLALSWSEERAGAYSCCWGQMEWLLARAVADTVAVNVSQVSVQLLQRSNVSLIANVSIDAMTDEQAIGVANALIGRLVARALLVHRVEASVSVMAAQAYDAMENPLDHVRVLEVGDDQIGDWYDANLAGLPSSTLVAVTRSWQIEHVLLNDTLEVAAGGLAVFENTVVEKACDSYRIRFAAVLPDYVTYAISQPFIVTNGPASALYVSPIPGLAMDDPYWPCWTPQLCSGTRVVAALPFAVTATVVDEFNNTCTDEMGAVSAMTVNGTGEVSGHESSSVVNGSSILYLTIEAAGVGYQIKFMYAPLPAVTSRPFRVVHGPLSRLRVQDEAVAGPVVAGQVLFNPFPEVELLDAFGNTVEEPLEVRVSLLSSPSLLLGTTDLKAADGSVTFADLSIQTAGQYTLVWACSGVQAVSRSFTVVPAPVSLGGSLEFERLPANAVAEEELTVQPVVELRDRFGNLAREAGTVTASAASMSGTMAVALDGGRASFTDLMIASYGMVTIAFTMGVHTVSDASADIWVGKPLAQLRVVEQPNSTLAGDCMEPYLQVALEDEDGAPVDFSRQTVSVDLSVNTFLYTQSFTCGSGGCSASTTFRFFLPPDATLVEAFVDVEVAKTDFDEEEEEVEYILFNGVPWVGGSCNPDEANECFSYFSCVTGERVTSLAQDNYFSVTVKISAAVNDFCAPRLQAVARLYGSYRPTVPETVTQVQDQNPQGMEGVTSMVASGRTVSFKQLALPVAGFGYRLRFFTDDSSISRRLLAGHVLQAETQPIDVLAVASTLEFETQPDDAIAGEPFGVQPKVRLLDKFENLVSGFEGSVTASIQDARDWDPTCSGGIGCWVQKAVTLSGLLVQPVDGGVVKFKNLTVDQFVNRMTLRVTACHPLDTSCTLTAISAPFQVSTAVTDLSVAGGYLDTHLTAGAQRVVVRLLSCDGGDCRSAATSQARIGAEVVAGSSATAIGGVTVVSASQGQAVFRDLQLTEAGVYQLRFFAADLGTVNSATATVRVVAASPAGIRVTQAQPQQTAGQEFEVVVQIVDQFENYNTEAAMSVVAQPDGVGWVLFDALSGTEDWVERRLTGGNATFQLRIDVAQAADIKLTVGLLPEDGCGASWTPCTHPQGINHCYASYLAEAPDTCFDYALCALFADGSCRAVCDACDGNLRTDACQPCTVSASFSFDVQADLNVGDLQATIKEQPGGAINGEVMVTQPVVFVETCQDSGQCNPTPGVSVSVLILSAVDQYTLVGDPFRTALGGTLTAQSDANGDAIFVDVSVLAPTDGATNITLQFYSPTGSFDPVVAEGFNVIGQANVLPTIDEPSPLLCTPGEDFDLPSTLYVHVGSQLELTVRASDNNTAPYDELSIDFTLMPGGLPPGAYLTEDMYDADNVELRARIADCGQRVAYNYTLMNRVTRSFVWAPISFYPSFVLSYRAVEAQRSGGFEGVAPGSSCTRSLELRVCDRPRFVAPTPLGTSGTRMVLAMTDFVFTVAAEDRNQADVVEIDVTQRPAEVMSPDEFRVGPEVHPPELQVTGLNQTRRNRVAREVRWKVPAGPAGAVFSMCFGARDDQFPCEAGGMVAEEELCLTCTLDALAIHATCIPHMRSNALNTRDHVPVCGDARITGEEEECDDGNAVSGDGCSSRCRLEAGYQLNATGSLPDNVCGDGLAVANSRFAETCDDGNTAAGDGCSAICEVEEGWECLECGQRWQCDPQCGDMLLRGAETCDDGNNAAGDGCDGRCRLEEGWDCRDVLCTVVEPICGDNITVGDEECDGGEGCAPDCTVLTGFDCSGGVCNTTCGDGSRVGREQCDDGNLDSGDGCDNLCRIEDFYGCVARPPFGFISGTIRPPPAGYIGEEGLDDTRFICDEICGDGFVTGVHGCDDGNNEDGDGCSAFCEIEEGWSCDMPSALPAPAIPCTAICGDGLRIQGQEECDDGNMESDDGCSDQCLVELAYNCSIGPKTAEFRMTRDNSSCLYAIRDQHWFCFQNDSAVTSVRNAEDTGGKPAGYACLNSSAICSQGMCGSSMGYSEEACFLLFARLAFFTTGNDVLALREELMAVDWAEGDECVTECGDGIRAGEEQCDDGNIDANDGCSPQCVTESGWYCLRGPDGNADACSSICGDGFKAGNEECDDGAWTQPDGDGCTDVCVQEAGFSCDHDPVTGRIDRGGCYPTACGDGQWVGFEQCDDGNEADLDGCSSQCTVEEGWVCGPGLGVQISVCEGIHGDGILVSSEQCEDGNAMSGDGCSSSGMIETGYRCPGGVCITYCGDGEIVGRETCDDNNDVDGDGCSRNCLIEQGWQCIPADCADEAGAGGCVPQRDGTGSYCEQCPPTRYGEVRCSHPPCPAVGLTADCKSWRMYEDGGWVHVAGGTGGVEAEQCRPEWKSDGYCDSINNNAEPGCDWDGGDCCSSTCACGSAGYPCYNGSSGGCGAFRDAQGDYHCIDPATREPGLPRFDPADTTTPFLSFVTVTLTPASPQTTMYYTLDGRIPAAEAEGFRVVQGELYTGPFNVTVSTEVKVSSWIWGLRIGQASLPIQVQLEAPVVSPVPRSDSLVFSPVIFSIHSPTEGGSIVYKFASADAPGVATDFIEYQGPFSVTTSGNLTAKAVKEGAMDSEEVFYQYLLTVSPVVASPPGEGTVFETSVEVDLSTDTVGAEVYFSLCNSSDWPRIANRTGGEIAQVSTDICYPLCRGLCEGGSRAGLVCQDENDVTLCGVGTCVVTVQLVRECYPSEWLPGATRFTGAPVVLNSTIGGSGTVLTSWATKSGLEPVEVSTTTYLIAAAAPTINVTHNTSLPIDVASDATYGPIELPASFSFNVSTPGYTIYYRLDGMRPTLGEGNGTFSFQEGDPPVQLTASSNITAIAVADNLLPSPLVWASVDVHQSTPSVFVTGNVLGARGLAMSGKVLDGFLYPEEGANTELLWNTARRQLQVELQVSLRSEALSANIFYRLLPTIATWPDITYRSGADWQRTAEWALYESALTVSGDVTVELIATWPRTSNSAIISVPLQLRTPCGVGTTSPDGLQPCVTCAQDSYLPVSCAGQSGSIFFGCQCEQCPAGYGTFAQASNASESCLRICSNGTYSSTGLDDVDSMHPGSVAACTPCPLGTYEPGERSSSCVLCPSGTTTQEEGQHSIFACRGASGLSAGGFHACGIREDRVAVCWGYNGFGQIEVPRTAVTFLVDGEEVVEDTDYLWQAVTAGSFHTCGVTVDGEGICWGQDYNGKTAVPPNVSAWRSMAASKGYHHTCGVGADLSGWCWGDDEYGQVGGVPAGMEWEVMSAGQFHSCGVNSSAALLCWGDNSYGQGDVPLNMGQWRTVSAGHYHSCGVLVEGGLACWGSSLYGATSVPPDVEAWSMVAVGRLHTCAVTGLGAMRCWGSNQDGALDIPAVTERWTAVTTGLFHSCGITADGRGYCWGRGVYGVTIVPDVAWERI